MSDVRVPSTNLVVIAGRLTRDPDLKYISSGKAVCQLSLANTRYYKDKSGERKEDTSFVDVTLWDKPAEWAGEHLRKGRPVVVEGRLKSDSWEDKTSGQKRSRLAIQATSVVPLDWDDEKSESRPTRQQRPPEATHDEPIPDDDIPF